MKIKHREKEKPKLKKELIKIAEINPAIAAQRAELFFTEAL